jgi:calcium-dependent protein kinase
MDHPNIIKLYDIYEDSKWLYVVTELCKGGNLLELINNFELTEEEVRIFMTQILSAVTYMHSNSIIHRDIKLENVVLVKQVEKLTPPILDQTHRLRDLSRHGQKDEGLNTGWDFDVHTS